MANGWVNVDPVEYKTNGWITGSGLVRWVMAGSFWIWASIVELMLGSTVDLGVHCDITY